MVDAFDYIESRADADELIEEFGTVVSIRRTTNSGPAWEPTQATADYATFGARIAFTWKQLQGGNVLATDQRWLLAAGPLVALGVEPAAADQLVVSGVVVGTIAPLDPLKPADVAVLFDCKVSQ